jgi:limonene-1,2-epoxide hydrolase
MTNPQLALRDGDPHQMVAIYELDDKGLIKRWREYLDMADLTRKMGEDEKFAANGG